jgi:arylsulfatase A-like enzyme
MTGIPYSSEQKLDGISFVPALKGKSLKRKEIFCHFPHGNPEEIEKLIGPGHQPSTYVRQGDWKLIRFYCDNPNQSDRYELYNLKNDMSEQKDLVKKYPKKARELSKLIDNFLIDTEAVIPVPNPDYVRK